MSQEPGLDGERQGPDPASAPWSAPDTTGDGRSWVAPDRAERAVQQLAHA